MQITFLPGEIVLEPGIRRILHHVHLATRFLPNLGSSTVYPWLDQDAAQDLRATEDSTVFPSRRSSERVKRAIESGTRTQSCPSISGWGVLFFFFASFDRLICVLSVPLQLLTLKLKDESIVAEYKSAVYTSVFRI